MGVPKNVRAAPLPKAMKERGRLAAAQNLPGLTAHDVSEIGRAVLGNRERSLWRLFEHARRCGDRRQV
jgi:hypothetical protein